MLRIHKLVSGRAATILFRTMLPNTGPFCLSALFFSTLLYSFWYPQCAGRAWHMPGAH